MTTKIITYEKQEDESSSGIIEHEGLCTRSPDGTLWKIEVDDQGVITTSEVVE